MTTRRRSLKRRLWDIVYGAVDDAIRVHADYLTPRGMAKARRSIVKRVVGKLASAGLARSQGSRPRRSQAPAGRGPRKAGVPGGG